MARYLDCVRWKKQIGWKLGILWNLGLLAGAAAAPFLGKNWTDLAAQAVRCPVGLIGSLCVTGLPVVCSVAAVMLAGCRAVWLLCPVRAAVLGLSVGAAGLSFGSSAPLMAFLLLFSGLVSAPVLLIYWYRQLTEDGTDFGTDSMLLLAANLAIAAVDFRIVAPVLPDLI